MSETQTFETHVYRPVAWSITWVLAVIAEGFLLWSLVTQPITALSVGIALLGAAAVLTVSLLRVHPFCVRYYQAWEQKVPA